MQGLLLVSIASLALGYNDGVVLGMQVPFHEYGWFWGLLLILAGQTFSESADLAMAKWSSMRVQLVTMSFFFNLAFLLLLQTLGVVSLKGSFQVVSLLFIIFGLYLISTAMAFYISENIKNFLKNIENQSHLAFGTEDNLHFSELQQFADRLRGAYKAIESQSKLVAIGELSAQVAHDIRSPLAALDAALKNTAELPEERRILVRHAVNRIRDIANNLLQKNQPHPNATSASDTRELLEAHLLSGILDPVVTEKRLQFESKPGVNIDFELTQASYGLFAKIQPIEFRRMISNLVNNAVEVLGDKGTVNLGLAHENENIILTVIDNGGGVPPEILGKLGQRGETHGKAGGSGLGLFHARTMTESWGGSMAITSELGKGTTVIIKLPKAKAPAEFVSVLSLPPDRPVVILDDDVTIHQVWQGRFKAAHVKAHNIEVVHFSEPSKLREWVKSNPIKAENTLYLFDYELLGYNDTGLSLAQELNISSRVILVTSRHEDPRIIEESLHLKTRIIPKGLANLVPISITTQIRSSNIAVLLDDDVLVHMNWRLAARAAGVGLKAYKTPKDFAAVIATLPKDTPIYIDSDLGSDIKGEDIAKDLHEKSFTDITMVTGHAPEKFANLPWLKVAGKESPWKRGS